MPFDPLDVIAECLGEPADTMRNPVNADYRCPYINGTCIKTNHKNALPLPVCSIYRPIGKAYDARPPPMNVTAKRLPHAPTVSFTFGRDARVDVPDLALQTPRDVYAVIRAALREHGAWPEIDAWLKDGGLKEALFWFRPRGTFAAPDATQTTTQTVR